MLLVQRFYSPHPRALRHASAGSGEGASSMACWPEGLGSTSCTAGRRGFHVLAADLSLLFAAAWLLLLPSCVSTLSLGTGSCAQEHKKPTQRPAPPCMMPEHCVPTALLCSSLSISVLVRMMGRFMPAGMQSMSPRLRTDDDTHAAKRGLASLPVVFHLRRFTTSNFCAVLDLRSSSRQGYFRRLNGRAKELGSGPAVRV